VGLGGGRGGGGRWGGGGEGGEGGGGGALPGWGVSKGESFVVSFFPSGGGGAGGTGSGLNLLHILGEEGERFKQKEALLGTREGSAFCFVGEATLSKQGSRPGCKNRRKTGSSVGGASVATAARTSRSYIDPKGKHPCSA